MTDHPTTQTVLVLGGSDYTNTNVIQPALNRLVADKARAGVTELTIVHGGHLSGCDKIVHAWAVTKGFTVIVVPAKWHSIADGRRAREEQRERMVCSLPHGCVAFPGADPDTVAAVEAADVKVWHPVQ